MTSTQELVGIPPKNWLVGIHNESASKSWSKYTTDDKVGKVNYVKVTCKTNPESE